MLKLLLAFSCFVVALDAGALQFAIPTDYPLSARGVAWAEADYDSDGFVDIATLTEDGNVTTALGDGDGGFMMTSYALGIDVGDIYGPVYSTVRAGDFTGDGVVDLLLALSRTNASGCVATLLVGTGTGAFTLGVSLNGTTLGTNLNCTGLDIGDFNGDGALDFMLSHSSLPPWGFGALEGAFNVFLGNGDGTFLAPSWVPLSGVNTVVSLAMTSGDFNADGTPDFVFAENTVYLSGSGGNDGIHLFLGDGAGGFAESYAQDIVGGFPATFSAMRTADFNGDGLDDLALVAGTVISGGYSPTVLPIYFLLNDGNGGFETAVPVASEQGVIDIEVDDADGDGLADLLLLSSEGRATLYPGDGSGGVVASGRKWLTDGPPRASLNADFNGDGRTDLAILDQSVGEFRIALTAPGGKYPLPVLSPLPGYGDQGRLAVGDFDHDNRLDAVASLYGLLAVLHGNGDGTFVATTQIATHGAPSALLLADLNGDLDLDLLLPDPAGGLQVLLGSPDGTFGGTTSINLGPAIDQASFGDIDGDGDLDVAAVSEGATSVDLYINDGHLGFDLTQTFPINRYIRTLQFADLNNDGALDLFLGCSRIPPDPNGIQVWLGDGSGSLSALAFQPGSSSSSFALGDVNGDGTLDIATLTGVALGLGNGTFAHASLLNPGGNGALLIDFDADDRLDLMTLQDPITVQVGQGDGSFGPPTNVASGIFLYQGSGAADFTGDGLPDPFLLRKFHRDTGPQLELIVVASLPPEPEGDPSCHSPGAWKPRPYWHHRHPHHKPPHWRRGPPWARHR